MVCIRAITSNLKQKKQLKIKFNLSNIKSHQLEQLNLIHENGGISFLIIYFSKTNRYFLLFFEQMNQFIQENKTKQIPIEYFEKKDMNFLCHIHI